jgi:hypothetical protein
VRPAVAAGVRAERPALPAGREPLLSVWRGGVRNPVTLVLLAAIRLYQLTVSPMLGPVCRFYPSCSHYGFEALRVHGTVRGTWYTARRLVRCHPWNPGGIDPVPARPSGRRRWTTGWTTGRSTPAHVPARNDAVQNDAPAQNFDSTAWPETSGGTDQGA